MKLKLPAHPREPSGGKLAQYEQKQSNERSSTSQACSESAVSSRPDDKGRAGKRAVSQETQGVPLW